MLKTIMTITTIMLISGCALKPAQTFEIQATPLKPEVITKIVEKPVPQPMLGQLKLVEGLKEHSKNHNPNVGQVLEQENEKSRQRPTSERFFNSITLYDYMPGTLYQVYASPGNITAIFLQPGEEIANSIMSGDSATWRAQIGFSGEGLTKRQVVYLKPLLAKRKTSMVIPTNKRVYQLELTSFVNSYMASVEWTYHEQQPVVPQIVEKNQPEVAGGNLNFNYKIKKHKGNPNWQPKFVFDDSSKTFIKFDKSINSQQIPALFLITRDEKIQMVNYRYHNETIIIDRIFDKAELRLGKEHPEIIKITRCE